MRSPPRTPGGGAAVLPKIATAIAIAALVTAGAACGSGSGPQATVEAAVDTDPPPGSAIVLADDDVWVVASTSFADVGAEPKRHAVVRIDRGTNEVVATVEMPHQMSSLAAGDGSVWAAGSDFGPDDDVPAASLVRIDTTTNEVAATVDLGSSSPADVAVGHGAVWVADSRGDRVIRVDPQSGEVVASVSVEGLPSSLAVTPDAVWVNKPRTQQIRPIDPDTNAPLAAVTTGPLPSIVEAGEGGVWVSDYAENELAFVDAAERAVTRTVDFGTAPSRFDVGAEVIAVAATEDEHLFLLDVDGGGRRTVLEGPVLVAVAVDGDTVWAVDQESRRVLRIALP